MAIDQRKNNNNNNNYNNNNNASNFEKPKQPQRGLGVAQLEKIRLHTQLVNCGLIPHNYPMFPSFFPLPPFQHGQEDMRIQAGYHQLAALQSQIGYGGQFPSTFHQPNNFMMGFGEHMGRTSNINNGDSQPFMTTRWNPNYNVVAMPENNNQFVQSHVVAMPENNNHNQFVQSQGLVTRHFLGHVEQTNRRDDMFASSSRNPMPMNPIIIDNEELDLELKL